MAIYVYKCLECRKDTEKNLPIKDRDKAQLCRCGGVLERKISFTGAVYSNTANGGLKV